MKEWITSIIASVIISSILSLILPEGKMGKYIKGIFSLFIILIIIKPIFAIENNDFSYEDIFDENVSIQTDYLEYISNKRLDYIKVECENLMKENGIINAELSINYNLDEYNYITINKIEINLQNAVIMSDKANIHIIEDVKNAIANYLNINKNLVVINE